MANNRSNMRPNMGPGVNPGAPGWIGPPMGMSAMGFGVVPQQPGGGMMPAQPQAASTGMMPQPGMPQGTTLNTWQQQQFMAAQFFSQRPFQAAFLPQQQQQHQQQQWLVANQKVAEEQRKQHELYLKQRQFNEQKQKLMAISGGKSKSGVSADSMINNILGGNGAPRPRFPQSQKQAPTDSGNIKSSPGSKAADWSSMPHFDDLFSHQMGGYSNSANYHVVSDVNPAASMTSDNSFSSSHGQTMGAGVGYDVNNTAVISGGEAAALSVAALPVVPPAVSASVGSSVGNSSSSGVALPMWLTGSNLPQVYTATLALVEGTEPGWVDTGRAYMLLMKTGLPPPFLAVLWEMANRTKPGQLNNEEFTVLLALVAIVQGGQPVNSVEVLKSCSEPVLPIIDHPALLPLVQDYIQKRQQQQQQQLHQQALEQDLVQEAAAAVQPAVNIQSPAAAQPTCAVMQVPPTTQSSTMPAGIMHQSTLVSGSQASTIPTLQQNTVPIVQTPTAAVLQPSAVGFGSKAEIDDDEFTDFVSSPGVGSFSCVPQGNTFENNAQNQGNDMLQNITTNVGHSVMSNSLSGIGESTLSNPSLYLGLDLSNNAQNDQNQSTFINFAADERKSTTDCNKSILDNDILTNPGSNMIGSFPTSNFENKVLNVSQSKIVPPQPKYNSTNLPMVPSDANSLKSLNIDIGQKKKMNLPELGSSPQMSPSGNNQNIAAAAADDDDDFADFQSAAPACQPPQQPSSLPTMGLTMPPPNLSSTNLSPHIPPPPPTTNPDSSFISSPSTTSTGVSSLTHSMTSVTPQTTTSNNSLLQPDSFIGNEDRYAAFRDLEEVIPPLPDAATTSDLPSMPGTSVDDDDDDDPDESFGDFCSSEPTNSLPNSAFSSMAFTNSHTISNNVSIGNSLNQNIDNSNPLSFVPNSVPEVSFEADFGVFSSSQAPVAPSGNYADIHEAMKKADADQKQCSQTTWNDPFGEFEEATSSLAVPEIINNSQGGDDDDFGDFVGPGTSDTPPDAASLTAFPRLPEGLAETQSVASLELPGLEVTVGLQLSDGRGSGSGQSPDLFMQARGDINMGLEDKLRDLSLESSAVASVVSSASDAPLTTAISGGINTSTAASLPVVDRYSIIRQEDNKESLSEAHTGSWERCLDGAVGLLEEANTILDSITDSKIKKKVLETSQMVGYIHNLFEVWCVVQRIKSSSQQVPTSTRVDTLLLQANSLWENIGKIAGQLPNEVSSSAADNENLMSQSEVCGVCLSGGGSKLMYGGAAYHPPCANLWINCIDLVLPSLTPVTLL